MSDVHTPMTLIEIRPHRWGWKVFELRASNLFSRRSVRQSIMRRIAHGFAPVRFGFWIQVAKSNAAYFFSSTITVWNRMEASLNLNQAMQTEANEKTPDVSQLSLGRDSHSRFKRQCRTHHSAPGVELSVRSPVGGKRADRTVTVNISASVE